MSSLTAFDLERVEVLKGPQGTLFGNNATGGAINFVAAKPSDSFEAGIELGYGRFNTYDGAFFVSGPVTSTLRARLAVKLVRGDEWQKSFTRDDRLGKTDTIAGRLLIDWAPTDSLTFALNLNAWRDRSDPQAPQRLLNVPQNEVPAGYRVTVYPYAKDNARSADWNEGELRPFADNRFRQATLRADYSFAGMTLTSLTNYISMKYLNSTEGGGSALRDLDIYRDQGTPKSFTQEVRLSNGGSDRFRWVLGGNYERTTVFQKSGNYSNDTTSGFVNRLGQNGYTSDSRMKNLAAFVNGEFDVTDMITLKGGVRRTSAKRDFFVIVNDDPEYGPIGDQLNEASGLPSIGVTDFFNAVYSAIYGGVVPTIPTGGGITLDSRVNPDGSPVNPATYLTAGPFRGKLNEKNTSWSVGVDVKPSEDLLLYANVSKGYKAGSYPHLVGTIAAAYNPVKQESLQSYEVGFKAQLLDRRLSLTGAAFYYDYRDKQLRAKFVDPIFSALDLLVNVPKSRVKGLEGSIQARPVQGLTLSASGTYLDAKVVNYIGVVGVNVLPSGLREPELASFKGRRLPFSPKFSYSFRMDYDTALTDSLNGFIGFGGNGQSATSPVLTTLGYDASYFDLNARILFDGNIGLRSGDNRWRVSAYGKNIFNKYYWINAVQPYDSIVRYAGRPAEYGVAIAYRF